jgi:archaemetzincin
MDYTLLNWRLELVPVGALPPTVLSDLCDDLESCFHREVRVADSALDPGPAFDPERRQYLATELMCQLLEPPPDPGERRIGVAAVDLYLPVFSHVFGTAQLGGHVGVASLYRLRPEYAGAPQDIGRMRERLAKEVLHELGHTFGLVHCRRPWCVMAASRLPEEIDLKDLSFCDACAEHLQLGQDLCP